MTSLATEIITLKWLAEKSACALERRIADLSAYLGREAVPEDGLSIEGWAALLRADGDDSSATLSDLSWAMIQVDPARWRRVFAAVLEMVLGAEADPRSIKIVGMLRSGASEEEWRVAVREASDAVRAAKAAAKAASDAAWAASNTKNAVSAAYSAADAAHYAARAAKANGVAVTALRAALLAAWKA